MDLKKQIRELSARYFQEVVNIRRHLHRYPELSFEEVSTSHFIVSKLLEWGIPFQKDIAKTGIVATLQGGAGPGNTVALRADMDALPITETNTVDYKSERPGVMHACGHDVHMASLLGTALILNELKNDFAGQIRLIFQPSEEMFPGGASLMIKEGVLENPVPACIFGQHTLPTLDAGKIGMKAGRYMASTDEVHLTVTGKGGHAATPELVVDPVVIAAHLLTGLQQIVSRHANITIPTLLSFGRFIADGRTNVIPDKVTLDGTFRTYDEKWRKLAHEKITLMARSIARGMGGDCEVEIKTGYPFLVNHPELTLRAITLAQEYLGRENVVELEMRMTAEDFAYYSQHVPGCFYRLGTRNEAKGIISNLHTSTFDIDETALQTGMGLMAWLAFHELSSV